MGNQIDKLLYIWFSKAGKKSAHAYERSKVSKVVDENLKSNVPYQTLNRLRTQGWEFWQNAEGEHLSTEGLSLQSNLSGFLCICQLCY